MKSIDTLVKDIYSVVEGNGGWDATVTQFLADGIAEIAESRFAEEQPPRNYLSLSQVGQPCKRKLWYKINMGHLGEPLTAEALGTFFYGDLLEVMIIALAKAAGHDVRGLQTKAEVHGVPGSLDVIIDGWLLDVKSASSYGFEKFAKNNLREDDPFGYISQLGSYLYSQQENPDVVQKSKAAFLVVRKDRFKLCLDVYDFSEDLLTKEAEIEHTKEMIKGSIPERGFEPVPDGKSGNMKLSAGCSYCEFKFSCWDNIRTFIYSTGPRYLTEVKLTPKVHEVK